MMCGQTFDTIITKEVDCPECFKKHTNMNYRYVDIYHRNGVVARIALGIMGTECLLHGVVEKWSRESFKAIKTGFYGVVIPGLQSLTVNKIIIVDKKEGSEKLMKFSKMLGFSKPKHLVCCEMEV